MTLSIKRYRQSCFWCCYFWHGEEECRRRPPAATMKGAAHISDDVVEVVNDPDDLPWVAVWPTVDPERDWCGEFREGEIWDSRRRAPKESDTDNRGVDPACVDPEITGAT